MDRIKFFLLVIFIGSTVGNEQEMMEKLLENYNTNVSPGKGTVVSLGFEVLDINMNEASHQMELHLWLKMFWYDSRLKFDTRLHPKALIFSPHQVWLPDITLYNNAEAGNFDHVHQTKVVVKDGNVIWVPPTNVAAKCVVDTTNWPHDVQTCFAKFGSWVYDAERIDLQIAKTPVNFTYSLEKDSKMFLYNEWILRDHKVNREVKTYQCCPEPYVSLTLTLTVERDSPAYHWLVQVPVVGLALLTIAVFLLPPSSGEKIILGGFGLVANMLMIMSGSYFIGHAPSHIPHILKLVVNQFILTLISLIVSAHVLRLMKDPHSSGLPRILKGPVVSLSRFLCLSNYMQMVSNASKRDETAMAEPESAGRGLVESGDGGKKEWLLLGAFIDRIFLVVYVVIFLLHMIVFKSVL